MLKARIIPCLDVKDGRVVKGVNFVDLKDAGDPVEQARLYDAAGADELCFLDIAASHENRDTLLDVVRATADLSVRNGLMGTQAKSVLPITRRPRNTAETTESRAKVAISTSRARTLNPTNPRGSSSSWMNERPASMALNPRCAA